MAQTEGLSGNETAPGGGSMVLAGRYRIVREPGRGGMGVVYLAEDLSLEGRKCALKLLPALLARNARATQALKKEALVSMELSHPNIVTLRAFEESPEGAFLVMDYVDGQTLEDLLTARERLGEAETLELLRPVARALDYAHTRRVIHRDVKPSNILIARDGTPWVTDFGVARVIRDAQLRRMTGAWSTGNKAFRNVILILLWPLAFPFVQIHQLDRHWRWEEEEGIDPALAAPDASR